MKRLALSLTAALSLSAGSSALSGSTAGTAIAAFNGVCFKAGQTAAQAQARMEERAGSPLPFALTFWDRTLEPGPVDHPRIERRLELRPHFVGHTHFIDLAPSSFGTRR